MDEWSLAAMLIAPFTGHPQVVPQPGEKLSRLSLKSAEMRRLPAHPGSLLVVSLALHQPDNHSGDDYTQAEQP